jgi:hypothetical protein
VERIAGISKEIDGCGGLIAQKARAAYRRVGQSHRRWIDEEDIVQDALVGTVECLHDYRPGRGAKFSTHLFKGLNWHLSHVLGALEQKKRDAEIVELDAPVKEYSITSFADLMASTEGNAASWLDPSPASLECERAFITLCRAVSEPARAVLIRGFLFSIVRGSTPELCSEIGLAAKKLRIGVNDLKSMSSDENLRKKILNSVSVNVMLNEGTEQALRVLKCGRCNGNFGLDAVREGRFFVFPMTCRSCLRELQKLPPSLSCFGKTKEHGREGYSEKSTECRLHCRDRSACQKFIRESGSMKETEDEMTSIEDVDLSDVEEKVQKTKKKSSKASTKSAKTTTKSTKSAKASKTEKPVKKAKAKPAKEEEEEDEGAGLVDYSPKALSRYLDDAEKNPEPKAPAPLPKWPYKRGSVTLYLFQRMLLGCVRAEMEKEITKKAVGVDFKGPFKVLSKGWAKGHKFTWKVDEEGGRLKLTDLKYHPKAA